ncbi:BTAD domain-containing putative transcriptional regulator [Actinoplanes sp. NPDC051851]|uniref:AfsR/SARP family transcriptional regulator n=1 Tax=Actinoplanes sp. NPDC051851 TaxID=3154753 RepID=UPI003445A308
MKDIRDDQEFRLLGPIRALRDGAEVALGSPQQRSTLAVLLLRRRELATLEELIDAVWGDEPPRAAVNTIRTYVSRLRRLLGADVITSAAGGYQLRVPAETIDVVRFQQHIERARTARHRGEADLAATELHGALRLRRGLALAGGVGPYLAGQRLRLEHLVAGAVEDQLAVELERGRYAEAIAGLTALVAEHPLRERLHEMLMVALYQAGRQAEALAQYRTAHDLLGGQLGIRPGAGLRRIHQQILHGDAELQLAS